MLQSDVMGDDGTRGESRSVDVGVLLCFALCLVSALVLLLLLLLLERDLINVWCCTAVVVRCVCVQQCVDRALLVARGGKHVLFLVRDPKAVTKILLFAATGTAGNAIDVLVEELLHRVSFRQCRSVYELLQELDCVERSWQVRALLCCSGVW